MEEEGLILEECTFKFSQGGNCNSKLDEYEEIEIKFESDIGIDRTEGGFFVIKTKKWSVNDASDLKEIFDRITKIVKEKKKPEELIDGFIEQWRTENNTPEATYSSYHYDAMIAFVEHCKKQNNV